MATDSPSAGKPTETQPATINPVDPLGAIDYRSDPSSGANPSGSSQGDYDNPIPTDGHPIEPWTDQTWAAYDAQTDASRYRGINQPSQQAQLHLSPQGPEDAQGYSPDLSSQLAWQRAGPDGSPPT